MGLDVDGVSVRFGGLAALTEVSLAAPSGAITGVIGPNGAGKTTLFNVMTGMQRTVGGSVHLEGVDLSGTSVFRRARLGLGRTFQRLELFGTLTVRENIAVAASIGRRRGRARAAASPTAIAECLLDQLHLRTVADTRADVLPTGTGRLVELGRVLAVEPSALLLDEPASGQDPEETERFAGVLCALADRGMAVVLVEHDMDLVMQVCSQVVVLDHGQVLRVGDPATIQADEAVRAAYLGTGPDRADG